MKQLAEIERQYQENMRLREFFTYCHALALGPDNLMDAHNAA
jgi:hypothetical protein